MGLIAEFRTCHADLLQGCLFECSMSSSEPSLKKVKVEHEPDGPLGCNFLLRELQEKREGGRCALLQGMRDDVAQGVRERVGRHLSEVSDGREG